MQGAFVVQLSTGYSEELSGRAEEVDTGRAVHFRSGAEILEFLHHNDSDQDLRFVSAEREKDKN